MEFAMMDSTDRNSNLVAHWAAESARLGKGEVMRIRGYAAAHEASLSEHEASVILITQANRFGHRLD